MAKHYKLCCFHLRFLLRYSIFLLSCFLPPIATDFELCNPGISTVIYRFKSSNCPFGVLFERPVVANCMNSTGSPDTFFSDLCDDENYAFSESNKPYKVHLSFGPDEEVADNDATCLGEGPKKCSVNNIVDGNNVTITEPDRVDPCDVDTIDYNRTAEEEEQHRDPVILHQTERMFKFMTDLYYEFDTTGPHYRVVKLLKQCIKILRTFCSSEFVPHEFTDDVLTAFLFLMREADQSNFKDVSVANYDTIMSTLVECDQMQNKSFNLHGKKCKTCSTVSTIEKDEESVRYYDDEFSFQWGVYDVPVDATWGIISFVHGLCYGTFKLNVNYHHLFQRVMESLFAPEILHRWNRTPQLVIENFWDNMFSAPVRSTMYNLDACVYAAYLNTGPFLHRLERPIREPSKSAEGSTPTPTVDGEETAADDGASANKGADYALDEEPCDSTGKTTNRPTMTLDRQGLTGAGWCFQTKEDLLATTQAYVDINCPTSRKALNELREQIIGEDSEVC